MLRSFWIALALALAAPGTATAQAAAAEPPPLDAYGELPQVETAVLSPEGTRIAVVGIVQGKRQLLFLDSSMRALRASAMGDVKLRGLRWIGEDAVLLIFSQTQDLAQEYVQDQFEAFQAIIIPVDPAKEAQIVFAGRSDIVPAIFGSHGIRQLKGEWYGYFGGVAYAHTALGERYVPHTRPELFAVRLSDGKVRHVADPARANYWRDWLIDSRGRVAATIDMNRTTGEWRLNGPDERIIAKGNQPNGDAGLVALGKDGKTVVYFARDPDDDTTKWYELPLDGSAEPSQILAGITVDSVYTNRTTGRIIGYERGGVERGPVFFDPARQAVAEKVLKAFRHVDVSFEDWTPDFQHLLLRTSGNDDSGTWFTLDVGQLRAKSFALERPKIPPKAVGPVSSFAYAAGDGLELDGVLTLPPGREPRNLPVIMLPHGGPGAYDEVQFDWWAQAFAASGYAVFQPNFRGSTNRDERFIRAGYGEWGRKMESDISDGLAALVKQGIVDPKRACIMGGSYGGYAALAGVTLQHGLYRCAVSVAGLSDLDLMYRTEYKESGSSKVIKRSLLEQLGPQDRLNEVSPRRFADQADAPILLIHGRDDTIVPFEQSKKMADALKDAHKVYKLVDLGSEDHWLSRSDTRKRMLEEAMAFIEKYDPPN